MRSTHVAATLLAALLAGPAAAAVDRIYAFGDSLNDCCNNPGAPFTNGPETWLPLFSTLVGGTYPTPETEAVNFAVGGAQSGTANAVLGPGNAPVPNGLGAQIAAFTGAPPVIGADDLAVIWVGTNDIWASAYGGDQLFGVVPFNRPVGRRPATDVVVDEIAGNIQGAVKSLRDVGFRQTLILTPYDMSNSALADDADAVALNGTYSRALRDRLLRLRTSGIDTYVLDMVSLLEEIQADAPGNGFTSLDGFAPCNPPAGSTDCDGFVFLDFVHLTTATNDIVAQRAADVVNAGIPVAPVPVPTALLGMLGALGGLFVIRRRGARCEAGRRT